VAELATAPAPPADSVVARLAELRRLAIVPALNEEANVGRVIEELRRFDPRMEVVVIDDGSVDGTAAVAGARGAYVVRLPFNLGIGGAVQTGYRYAFEHGFDVAVQVDGDGQHDPAEIRHLMRVMRDDPAVDVVCGSRFLDPECNYPAPFSRRTGIHLFAFLLRRLVGQRVTDPTSGFRLYNRRAIKLFARNYPHDFPEVEAILVLHHHRLRMRETPVTMFERGGGVSSLKGSGKSAYYMVKVLLALFIGLARRRPIPEPGGPAPVQATHSL
jgi:glycosyltransferase involved in cell wall biosynthesis